MPALMVISNSTPSFAKGVDPEERVEYYLYDHLGGVDAILDEQGNVVERRDYLPFGEERVAEGTDKEHHGFTGKELDSESGLYYYGARYYDPALGRFASLDPLTLGESLKPLQSVLADPQELNSYSYVMNNPLKYVDPTGEWGVAEFFGGKSHQYIVGKAIDGANNKLTSQQAELLEYSSSVWSDILVYAFEGKKEYNHSMSYGALSAIGLKSAMMGDAKKWYTSGNWDEFSRLIHMVGDTFSPAHTERDDEGNITAFLDFSKQSLSLHMKYDNYEDENGNVRPEATQAIRASSKLIDLYQGKADWSEVKKYLDTEVLKGVNLQTEVGVAGKKFEKKGK